MDPPASPLPPRTHPLWQCHQSLPWQRPTAGWVPTVGCCPGHRRWGLVGLQGPRAPLGLCGKSHPGQVRAGQGLWLPRTQPCCHPPAVPAPPGTQPLPSPSSWAHSWGPRTPLDLPRVPVQGASILTAQPSQGRHGAPRCSGHAAAPCPGLCWVGSSSSQPPRQPPGCPGSNFCRLGTRHLLQQLWSSCLVTGTKRSGSLQPISHLCHQHRVVPEGLLSAAFAPQPAAPHVRDCPQGAAAPVADGSSVGAGLGWVPRRVLGPAGG